MSAALLAAALLGLAPGALEVSGDSTCPTAAEVARRLGGLLAPAVDGPAPRAPAARVFVTHDGAALRLVLLGENANELATRELSVEGACDDLAEAAAVVVASWQADLDTNLAPGVALPARQAAPAALAPSPPAVARVTPAPAAPPRRLELGLGLIVSDVGGDLSPGAILTGGVGRDALGLIASIEGTTSRTASVGALTNVASWTRVTVAAGPAFQPRRRELGGELHVQGLLGVLHVRGVGLANPGSDTTAQLGVAAGAKVEVVTGTSAVWLGLDVLGWPGVQRLIVTKDTADQARLPRLEVVLSLGLSLGRFP